MKYLVLTILLLLFSAAPNSAGALNPRNLIHLNFRNTLELNFEINLVNFNNFAAALVGKRALLPPDEVLYIVINSPGGSVRLANDLNDFLNILPNTEVICEYCASAAGMIFATTRHKRLVFEDSVMVMHEMFYDHVTAEMGKNPKLIPSLVEASEKFDKLIYSVMKITREEYRKHIIGTQWVVYGQELVDRHLANSLVKIDCDDALKIADERLCSSMN